MRAVVVYESLWGNTAAVAEAIAEGIGGATRAYTTSGVSDAVVTGADLLVAGAPVLGFALPTDAMRASIAKDPKHAHNPADTTHPSLREWLSDVPHGSGRCAAFETRISWSPRGSAPTIRKLLRRAGYRPVEGVEDIGRFLVEGTYGPLADGELDRAREWGVALAKAVTETTGAAE